MAEETNQNLTGKRKGGTRFPRETLETAAGFAAKLASKTHVSAQPADIIYPGVFNSKVGASTAEIRASALKQFGLMSGTTAAYSATPLAKQLAVAEGAERTRLLRIACLKPAVFAALFKTYHGDRASFANLRQRAGAENVHSEEVGKCVDLFADSAVFASLATRDGDGLRLISELDLEAGDAVKPAAPPTGEAPDEQVEDELGGSDLGAVTDVVTPSGQSSQTSTAQPNPSAQIAHGSARSVVQVRFTLDSSFETEKLAKQLELLKQYGVI